jgi:hypothetical protein
MDTQEAEKMVSEARTIIVGKAYIRAQKEQVDVEKAALLVKMGQLSSIYSE